MNEFRRLATKIDQHMQQLAAQGVNDPHVIINRMMGYTPDLHKIWVETSNDQLAALCSEFPGFHRYARFMEEASEAERNKTSRPYDGAGQFPEPYKHQVAQLLTTAATLERGYQAFLNSGRLRVFQPQVDEMHKLYQQWLCDLDGFKSTLRAHGAEPRALTYVNEAFAGIAERIKNLAAQNLC
jgi:hypothetical protein